jgi:glutamine---fructose-6-phosphate transaminase (isomerizing)
MCGIFGILSKNRHTNVKNRLLMCLNLLKNRGYDSCGVFMDNNNDSVLLKYGVEDNKEDIFNLLENGLYGHNNFIRGIGHTRWATHGMKSNLNAHPHTSPSGRYIIIHNGIISNYTQIKNRYLRHNNFKSHTDSEVIIHMIEYLYETCDHDMIVVLSTLDQLLDGTWACLIIDCTDHNKIYFMKNQNPLLIGFNNDDILFTSESIGFTNSVDSYANMHDHCYGYYDITDSHVIIGEKTQLPLIKLSNIHLVKEKSEYWMKKEIWEQLDLRVLYEPIGNQKRYGDKEVLFHLPWVRQMKYLYIIGCGSSYYAGLIASNYFRYMHSFEMIYVIDGGDFSSKYLETLNNPVEDLLIIIISQSGETRDLNLCVSICHEFTQKRGIMGKIKILGIINVIGSLISHRTIDNIYTNCGRENAVASTKSCTAQILVLFLLSIYKSQLLHQHSADDWYNSVESLGLNIKQVLSMNEQIKNIAYDIIMSGHRSMFLLGKDELYGVALEGALKIKEVAYIHAEGFHISALKHGSYALICNNLPVIMLTDKYDHVTSSIYEELKTRQAFIILIGVHIPHDISHFIRVPYNTHLTCVLHIIILQLLAYNLSLLQHINPDMPRNLAKVVTVD